MAKKYHPDVNKKDPSAEKKFSEASEAYEVCLIYCFCFHDVKDKNV